MARDRGWERASNRRFLTETRALFERVIQLDASPVRHALGDRPTSRMDYMLTTLAFALAFTLGVLGAGMFLVWLFFRLWERIAERGLPTRRPLRRK